ncbi:MAG: hypothetical protein Kow0040_01890 [Thermogutta sp.]
MLDGDDAELATLIRKLSVERAEWLVKLPKIREEFEELRKADPEAAIRIASRLWFTITDRPMPTSKSKLRAMAIRLGFPADSLDRVTAEDIIDYVVDEAAERYLILEPLQRCAIAAGASAGEIDAIKSPAVLAACLEKMFAEPKAVDGNRRTIHDGAAQQQGQESAAITPTGFMGAMNLAEAFGVPEEKRKTVARRLQRAREKNEIPDCDWKETTEPTPHSPRFLYRADSDAVRRIVRRYTQRYCRTFVRL